MIKRGKGNDGDNITLASRPSDKHNNKFVGGNLRSSNKSLCFFDMEYALRKDRFEKYTRCLETTGEKLKFKEKSEIVHSKLNRSTRENRV